MQHHGVHKIKNEGVLWHYVFYIIITFPGDLLVDWQRVLSPGTFPGAVQTWMTPPCGYS